MKTLQIEIPEGYMFDSLDQSTRKIKLKAQPKNVMERIKTVADVLADHGLTKKQFDEQCEGLTDDEIGYRLVKLLTKSLNEEWAADWNDSNQTKHTPWFYMGGSGGFRFGDFAYRGSCSDVGSRLCFKSRELAIYAGENFTDVYKQFML